MFVLPEVVLQTALVKGIAELRAKPSILDEIFCQYVSETELQYIYGQEYLDGIKEFFTKTDIPVVQAFSFDPTKIPGISVHLASEQEDESKALLGDYFGQDDVGELLTGVMTVNLDIGIHADRSKDHVLWLYYMVSYILYKQKRLIRKMGLQNITFSASDYNKDSQYMAENIWSRWMRLRCTVQNYIEGIEAIEPDTIDLEVRFESSAEGEVEYA